MKTKLFCPVFGKMFRRDSLVRRAVALAAGFSFTLNALANPAGMTVSSGSASLTSSGSQLNITAGNNAVLNWQSFNIAAGETTTFNQPSAGSIVWNRIGGNSASQIYGTLQANGVVILLNSSGFYFGPDSFVSTAGLVVSTANCLPPQNAGGSWEFNGPPPLASIVNYGTIRIGNNGSAFLIANDVENHGTISAPGGTIGLAAGQTVELSERPDGRGMSMNVTLPQGAVNNYGTLVADAGTISLNAKVVNQNGVIQANSVQDQNGVIELVASDAVNLGANSQILAQGDNSTGGSAGGNVTIQSGNNFSDTAGGTIVTAGGANGGSGGNVEISAPNVASLNSTMDATAQAGWTGGTFFLDPVNIVLGTSTAGGAINVNTAFAGFSSIQLQASGNITLNANTTWNLSTSTGQTAGQLTLQAGGDITIGSGSLITDANNWSVSLAAGYNFVNNASTPGSGSILFNGSGAIKTSAGGINLLAGLNITVGSGYVITTGGGGINAQALAGSIYTGSDAQGYYFEPNASSIATAYDLGSGSNIKLGGISTAAGGDVNLTAGGSVTSYLPVNGAGSAAMTAGCGAYGKQAGNVTIVAGGDVTGNYLVANGTGSIYAGVQMDANGNPIKDASGNYVLVATVPDKLNVFGKVVPGALGSAGNNEQSPNLALNVISGGWNVTAAQDICLQEVRNPNGIFNVSGPSSLKHYFDYAPDDFVNLNAGYLVQLGASASALPRVDTLKVPVIYPGILNINAGAGGVILKGDNTFNQLILFPSPDGSLTINTTGGGPLTGSLPTSGGSPQLFNIIVSDSGRLQYQSSGNFGLNDHAGTPIHLGSPTPIDLNISGDMNLVLLGVPEAAQINVVGNMNNCGFEGMNLSDSDVTSLTVGQAAKVSLENQGILNPATDGGLTVGGNINNRSAFTSINLSAVSGSSAPNLSYLSQAVISSPPPAQLAASFAYNPVTQTLTYQRIPGVNLASLLQQMQNLTVQVYVNGVPQWADPPDDTIPVTTTVSVLNAADAAALLAQYNSLGNVPAGNPGYVIGGGGQFNITANNLDLGTTPGIQSEGVGYYQSSSGSYPLASLFTKGADINISLTGDLNMYSSAIASLNGGSISINAGGSVNAGSPDFTVNSSSARGIYTAGQGDVSVIASGDINVNGSRIAAYDGGNVTVESLNGNISAGSGGDGFVIVYDYTVNPVTRAVTSDAPTIPGSGILATTFPHDTGRPVGNILVETPNGNVSASAGGIVQLPLNGVTGGNSIVEILAGSELRDSSGKAVSAADISAGTPVQVSTGRSIDASGSGVIGNTVKLDATGNIVGVIFARDNIDLNAQQNVNVTALAQGSVSASAGGSVSGTIIGIGGVSASGSSIDASLQSNNNITGDTSGGKGLGQGTAANSTSQGMASDDTAKVASTADDSDDDKKKKQGIALAQKVSRVTVLLPEEKKLSEKASSTNPL